MGTPQIIDDLTTLRGRVQAAIRQVVTWGGLFAIIASVSSSVAAHDWHEAWILERRLAGTYLALMALFWWPGATVAFRGGALVLICFASGSAQLLNDATHGSGYQLLLATAVFSGLLHNRRLALVEFGIIVFSVVLITGLYGLRIIHSPDPAVGGMLWWMSWSLSFTVIAAALVGTQQYIVGQLLRNLEQLRKASAAKDELLAMVSHELRTPLTPVLLTLSGMERAADMPQHYRADLTVAREQIELEARLVNDLLDLSRVVTDKLNLLHGECNVREIIHSVVLAMHVQIESKQLTLRQSLDAINCDVDGDNMRLQQVFRNLMENAIKFTPPDGSITICSRNDGEWLIVEVQDTGIGMDAAWLQRAFVMFEQVDRSITREYGGMGIGLTICKSIIDGHGGKITAASEGKDKGCTFTVRLRTTAPQKTPAS